MAEKIKQNIFVFYSSGTPAVSNFTFNISNIAFQPDTLIVRYASFYDRGTATTNIILLNSDLIGNRPLVSFLEIASGYYSVQQDVYHKFNINPQGTFTFTYMTAAGSNVSLKGDIALQLEFSKGYY